MGKKQIVHAQIEDNDFFGRKIRSESNTADLGRSSYVILQDEIEAGNKREALELLDYMMKEEGKPLHDGYADWIYADLDYVAKKYGEEFVPQMVRHAAEVMGHTCYRPIPDRTLKDLMMLSAEFMRGHKGGKGETGEFEFTEDNEKYVMTFDPCGNGGRIRRTGEIDGLPPRTEDPCNLGVTTKPYDWSWGKEGVPYCCVLCCVAHEQMSVESMGFPVKVTLYNDVPNGKCGFAWYKNPDNIPEEYFTRIGKVKDPSKFKRLPDHEG